MIYAGYVDGNWVDKNVVTRTWKVYGRGGRPQEESYSESMILDVSRGDNVRVIETFNADITGTHDYTIVRITRNTSEECADELRGQLSDGIFENKSYGKREEV